MKTSKGLSILPEVGELQRRCQALAVLDAIFCPEWEFRYFSFNPKWAVGEKLGAMRNGEGDDWQILFSPNGVLIKGFALESAMAEGRPWAGVVDSVPEDFRGFLDEIKPSLRDTTFCFWRRPVDDGWRAGPVDLPEGDDPDGSAILLRFVDGDPETYREWGEAYFGVTIDQELVARVYGHEPLTESLVRSLNREVGLAEVAEEVTEIGYPG